MVILCTDAFIDHMCSWHLYPFVLKRNFFGKKLSTTCRARSLGANYVMSDPVNHHSADYRLAPALISHRDGILRADNFDDLYFSADNGLDESQHVFIDGNHIADRLSNAAHFTIAETGFGTGLNFLAVMKLLEDIWQSSQNAPG